MFGDRGGRDFTHESVPPTGTGVVWMTYEIALLGAEVKLLKAEKLYVTECI
jgi:hypothetical protein